MQAYNNALNQLQGSDFLKNKSNRVVRGNQTTIPSGTEIFGAYRMQAISQIEKFGKGNLPIPSEGCVVMAKNFVDENHK